jgi:glycosyltransferase involved in cell wall biosynthesis
MKVLQINTVYKNGGSTGRIVYDLHNLCNRHNIDSYVAYGYEFVPLQDSQYENTYKMCSLLEMQWSKLQTRILGQHGFYNTNQTRRLINWVEQIKPDIIHLHNLHNHYLNVAILFDYLKKNDIPVIWTLHDCWSFTGWCAYFDYVDCNKWKTGCHNCPALNEYPYTWFFDRSKSNYLIKKELFNGVNNLTLVPPSEWLGALTRDSFLKNYPVKVINNGVDTDIFKPLETQIKQHLGIEGKKMILAVAAGLSRRKGGEFLLSLPEMLNDDEVLVLLGVTEKQLKELPKEKCIGITYTNSTAELAEIYSAADVFVNPTLEDNFPTTNIEALACGTPVITFNTGGSVEVIEDSTGFVVEQGDMEAMLWAIRKILRKGKSDYSKRCSQKALTAYNKDEQYMKYIQLYRQVLSNK